MSWRLAFCMLSAVMALQGVLWALSGRFDPLGWWDGQMAQALFERRALTPEEATVKRFILVQLGATDAGFFVLCGLVACRAERLGERYAISAAAGSLGVWWIVDSAMCVVVGAWFNVMYVHLPAAVLLGVVLGGWGWTSPRGGVTG